MTTKAPAWATKQKAERVELKAARLAALYLLRDELGATPKTHLAEALGISRWTYDRLLASLPEVEINIRIVQDRIKQEIEMDTYYINEEMLGDTATEQDARRMVELLAARGYDVAYGHGYGQDEDAIPTAVWEECLDIISRGDADEARRIAVEAVEYADGEGYPVAGTTVVGIDDNGYWVSDNGEEVNGLTKEQAIEIIIENLTA